MKDTKRITYGRTSVYNLNYHLIWGTKYRNKVLKERSSPKCWCKLNSANLSFHKLKHTGFF
ncbi:transposase [Limosilactobacillus fermentum]